MKIQNIILPFLILFIFNSFSLSAQQKITIIEDSNTTYESPRMQWQYKKTHKTSRDQGRYVTRSRILFKVEGDEKLRGLGKNGEQLRFYLRDSEAEALLDKAFKQEKMIPVTGGVAALGMITGVVGLFIGEEKSGSDYSGFFDLALDKPMFLAGATIVVGSYITSLVLKSNSKKNIYKSVDIHNNSITSSMDADKIRLDGIGVQWNNQSSRPQLSLRWTF